MRSPDDKLNEIINNHGTLATGPISALGVLRLALDLQEARFELKLEKSRNKLYDSRE
jgi:hypothetical protein